MGRVLRHYVAGGSHYWPIRSGALSTRLSDFIAYARMNGRSLSSRAIARALNRCGTSEFRVGPTPELRIITHLRGLFCTARAYFASDVEHARAWRRVKLIVGNASGPAAEISRNYSARCPPPAEKTTIARMARVNKSPESLSSPSFANCERPRRINSRSRKKEKQRQKQSARCAKARQRVSHLSQISFLRIDRTNQPRFVAPKGRGGEFHLALCRDALGSASLTRSTRLSVLVEATGYGCESVLIHAVRICSSRACVFEAPRRAAKTRAP